MAAGLYGRIHGLVLMGVVLAAIVWLAVTGNLALYIHPRSIGFTLVLTALGLIGVVWGCAVTAFTPADDHDHDHDHDHAHTEPRKRWRTRLLGRVGAALTLLCAAAVLIIPPATLTTATATQREINSTGLGTATIVVEDAQNAVSAQFSVRDWAALLRQTDDPAFYAGKPATVTGFITAATDDTDSLFYLSRFVVTCCAVDAQPVGVPVYLPEWADAFATDGWVEVRGEFRPNPGLDASTPLVLIPTEIVETEQPGEPYLY